MSTFNFNRFSQALKCHFLVERKSWIRLFGIYTLVMFMANMFFTRVRGWSYSYMTENFTSEQLISTYTLHVDRTSSFAVIFFCIAMLFCASFMFSQMKDTRKRSAYLLWPVSNLEKYVVSLLYSVVFMAILTVAAIIVADALRVFIDWLTGRIVIWGFTIPLKGLFSSDSSLAGYWQMAWMFFVWVFYIHSLYLVGGTLFRRQQFLLTSATIVIVTILLVMMQKQIDLQYDFITGNWDEKTETYTQTFHTAFYVINSVVTLLIPFHYWVSYKLFTRMQVINNKWLNV